MHWTQSQKHCTLYKPSLQCLGGKCQKVTENASDGEKKTICNNVMMQTGHMLCSSNQWQWHHKYTNKNINPVFRNVHEMSTYEYPGISLEAVHVSFHKFSRMALSSLRGFPFGHMPSKCHSSKSKAATWPWSIRSSLVVSGYGLYIGAKWPGWEFPNHFDRPLWMNDCSCICSDSD